jgi:DNA modification methylase
MSNISELRFDDKNMNAHTAKGMGLLEKSLQQFGAGRSILIDKNNRIIGGNGVVEAAGNIGLEEVQIVESDGKKIIAVKRTDIDLDSAEGRELAMADNAVAAEDLSWDKGNIEEVSEQFGIDPGDWISDWDKEEDTEVEEDEAPEVDESEPAKSELSKVYKLGEHRLMCGDSTDSGSVAILMSGEKADLVFTSPPYNGGGNTAPEGDVFSKKGSKKLYDNGYSDDKSSDEYVDFAKKVLDICFEYTDGFIFWNVNYNANSRYEYISQIIGKLGYLIEQICWKKSSAIPLKGCMRRAWEPIYVFSTNKSSLGLQEVETNYWEVNNTNSQIENHKACFPVELPARGIRLIKPSSYVVLEPFGGSGSTLIACEQLGRKCYMMELDPKYCDVIRKRWWKFTHDGDEEGWEEGTPAIGGEE